MRRRVIDEGVRLDGRGVTDIRPLSAEIGVAFFVLVALMWLVPDRRLERVIIQPPVDGQP